MSDRQDISRIQDSTIFQAGGNLTINQGLRASDVLAIVKDVVSSELAIYSQNAEKKAEERLNQFSNSLVEQLAKQVSDKLDRFNEPSLQFAVRNAALSYVKSGKEADEKALVDLMIERVKVDEHTTKQKLIDQAIKIIPSLSSECLALLSLIVFRSLTLTGTRVALERWIDSMNPVLDIIQNVTSLDIEYLTQADCVTAMQGFMVHDGWMELCPKQNDLFYRHPVPVDAASEFKQKYGIASFENGFTVANHTLLGGHDSVIFIAQLLQICQDGTIRFMLSNSSLVDDLITRFSLPNVRNDVYKMIQASALFSPEDVRKYYIARNPKWEKAIDLMDGQRLRAFTLLPVGAYIGSRQLSMLSGQEIALETFYK